MGDQKRICLKKAHDCIKKLMGEFEKKKVIVIHPIGARKIVFLYRLL